MTRTEHLLCIMAEECNEVAQRVSKALRFGLTEVQPGQEKTNAERIVDEYCDLLAVMRMLVNEGCLPDAPIRDAVSAKRAKIEKFLAYSKECGTLDEPKPITPVTLPDAFTWLCPACGWNGPEDLGVASTSGDELLCPQCARLQIVNYLVRKPLAEMRPT